MIEEKLIRFLNDESSHEEKSEVCEWINQPGSQAALEEILRLNWTNAGNKTIYIKMLKRIHQVTAATTTLPITDTKWPRWMVMSASILLLAASASKTLMDEEGYEIDEDYAGLFLFGSEDSPEIILQVQYLRGVQTHNLPRNYLSRMALGHSNKKPPQDMVDTYDCIDGLPIDESPLFDPQSPFENRDPRLEYTLVVPGSRLINHIFDTNPEVEQVLDFSQDPPVLVENIEADHAYASFTGYLYRKHVDPANYPTDVSASEQNLNLFRLAEILLNYAEAKVELNELDNTVYDAINAIRTRPSVNMPPILPGKSQEELRNVVRKERRHEMGMEGLRYFDIRRWRIAHEVIPGPLRGRVNRYSGGGWLNEPPAIDEIGTPSYDNVSNANQMVVIETRNFDPERDYLWPIPRIELETNTALIQNPNY